MAAARSTIDNAIATGAADAAPIELRSAQEKLDRANAAMAAKDYVLARRWAEEAQADAKLALLKDRSIKSERAAQQVNESVRVMTDELNRQPR